MSKRHINQTYPAFCNICGCPIQLLADGNSGKTKGTIEDALQAHASVVHPNAKAVTE